MGTGCNDCEFEAKSVTGLKTHRNRMHPKPAAPVTVRGSVELLLANHMGDPRAHAALKLAGHMDDVDTPARDASALSRELRTVLAEINEFGQSQGADGGDEIDEIGRKRAARLAGGADSAH
jgi:hypothetical protein